MNFFLSKAKLRRLAQSKFIRNVIIVATGAAGAHAITMAFTPIVTRIYGPEEFGLLGIFMAVVAAVIPLAALAYPIAIVLPKEDKDAIGLVKLSIILSFVIAFLATGIILLSGDWISVALGVESIAGFLILIPLSMLFSAWLQIIQQWLIRKKKFESISRSAVIHSMIINSVKVGAGWMHPVGATLIVIATISYIVHVALLMIDACKIKINSVISEGKDIDVSIKYLAIRYYDFALYRAPQNFINSVSQGIPVLMLAAYFGAAAAGFYTLAMMVMVVPSVLLGKAVRDVFYPRVTEASHNNEDVTSLIVKSTLALAVIGILPFSIVIIFGPWLFGIVFGVEWVLAGEYARWLAFWMYVGLVNIPSVVSIPVLAMQGRLLAYDLVGISGRIIALWIGFSYFEDDILGILLLSSFGVLWNILLILYVIFNSKRKRGLM